MKRGEEERDKMVVKESNAQTRVKIKLSTTTIVVIEKELLYCSSITAL